jgi:glycosyltransferase involved in cell wall biosynthesis
MQANVRPQRTMQTGAAVKLQPIPALRAKSDLAVVHLGKYYPPARGGMESHLEVLSNELKDLINLKLIVANEGRHTVTEGTVDLSITRVGEILKLQSAPICPALIRELRNTKADIIHLHWPNPMAVLAYLLSGFKGKLIFTYHSDVVRQRKLAVAFQPVLRMALERASAIIATSPNYVETSDVLLPYRAKCRVIPFGVPTDYFEWCDAAKVKSIRERYGPQIVLGVGRMVYYKGFEHLVRAMALAQGTLLLIGQGPQRELLDGLVAECNLQDRVVFLNEVEDVRPYYHAADIFVLPSVMRSEAFGIVQLEAMTCGKPIINTELDSGVNYVSPSGVSGLTVPPADHIALGNAINYLLERPYLRTKLGIGGRCRVARDFTVQGMVQQTLDLYEEVAGSANGNGHSNGNGLKEVRR